jgi:hypothetical protein
MHETPEELARLQDLLDRSSTRAGAFLRQAFRLPHHSLSATQLVQRLTGVRPVALATVSARGAPRVAPVSALFWHGQFAIPTVATAARTRHVRAQPAVSLTYFEGSEFAVIVHGRAVVVGAGEETFTVLDKLMQELGERSVQVWGAGIYLRIEAETIYTYTSQPEGRALSRDANGAAG